MKEKEITFKKALNETLRAVMLSNLTDFLSCTPGVTVRNLLKKIKWDVIYHPLLRLIVLTEEPPGNSYNRGMRGDF